MRTKKKIVVTKPTLGALKRQLTKRDATVKELNANCLRHLRDVEQAEKELGSTTEARDELQTILNNLETVIQFRLDTVYDEKPSQEYDIHGNPRPMVDRETPEEQKVLYKLLYMVTAHTRKTERNLHGTLGRNY